MLLLKTKKWQCGNHFLVLLLSIGKTAYDIKKIILDQQLKEKLNFKICREIGFDNVASMTGFHGGIQCL